VCNVSTGVARPVVPETWRRRVFDTFHSLSHPGARTTKKLVSSKFIWHGLGRKNHNMGPLLRPLPTRKNSPTYEGTVIQIRTNIPTFRTCPHQPGGPPTGISRLLVPPHSSRSFHSLARGHSNPRNGHIYYSQGIHPELGSQVRRTVAHDLRQRSTVRVRIVVMHEQFAWHGFAPNHCVPPSGQWIDRTQPPGPQSISEMLP
jgi:hypothetical protein